LISDVKIHCLETALLSVKPGKAAGFFRWSLSGIHQKFWKENQRMVGSSFQRHFDNRQTTKTVQTMQNYRHFEVWERRCTDVSHYRPISLLSVVYKILERLILQRIQPLIEWLSLCLKQVFGRTVAAPNKSWALTSHIEAGFERKLKTGTIFIDLTAAYDTVWRDELMLKFMRVVSCSKIYRLLNNMLSNRYFQVISW
jgi:hypothetical protein